MLRPGPAHGNKEVVSDSPQKQPWGGDGPWPAAQRRGDRETSSSGGGGKIRVEQSRIMLLECT